MMSTTIPSHLPHPADNPRADVVIFDGHCRFCQGQVARLCRIDGKRRLAFISLHDPSIRVDYPDLSHDQLMQEMYIIDSSGNRHAGASAIRYLSRRLPRLWWLAPFVHLPGSLPVWRWLYRQVANRRYRLGGAPACDNDSCAVHLRK